MTKEFDNFTEEFQFKPITEGLGFHKKTLELKEELLNNVTTQTGILPKSKNPQAAMATKPLTTQPLQRPAVQTPSVQQKPAAPAHVWKGALANKDFVDAQKQSVKLIEIASNWPAAFFDMAMVAGITLLFSAVVFAMTQLDLVVLVESLKTDFGLQASSVAVVFAVLEIYTVATRTFFGKTMGEWVFDSRLGTTAEQSTFSYPFKVAWRTLVITFTGFVTLPLLGTLIGEDLAGILSGVKLYAEKK